MHTPPSTSGRGNIDGIVRPPNKTLSRLAHGAIDSVWHICLETPPVARQKG